MKNTNRLNLRNVVVIAICLAGLSATVISVSAQPRAIGGRVSWGFDVSYQHGFGERNMLQIDVGVPAFYFGIQAVGTYNWLFPISSWKHAGSWNWYIGVGAGGGVYAFVGPFFAGVAGQLGIEYNFKIPLQLSLDFRPVVGPTFTRYGIDHYLNVQGFLFGGAALSVRYKFKKM